MPRAIDVEERRDQILRAAVAVFSERGYTNATISDIANEAGIAHGTIYLYFPNKAAIFQSLVAWFVDRLIVDINGPDSAETQRRIAEIDGTEPPATSERSLADDLYRMLHGALERCAQAPRLTTVCMREAIVEGVDVHTAFRDLGKALVERVSARVRRASLDGEARPISEDFAGFVIVNLLHAGIRRVLAPDAAANPDQVARELVDFIMFGIAAEALRNNSSQADVLPSGKIE